MGEAEINYSTQTISIQSRIITYGNAATDEITQRMRDEIEMMWNEPLADILIQDAVYRVKFFITAQCIPELKELEVLQNTNPRNNYFRIENFVHGNISFVDGLGSNTGYFLYENLYEGSTTAAHEYGHTIGLDHPRFLDIRGQGTPGIMYPRGTLVDPQFQYDPSKPAGITGGTMHPMHRRVKQEDLDGLKIHRLRFVNNCALLGDFTNIYHWPHPQSGG